MNNVTQMFEKLNLGESHMPQVLPERLCISGDHTKTEDQLRIENDRLRRENMYLKWLLCHMRECQTKIPKWVS